MTDGDINDAYTDSSLLSILVLQLIVTMISRHESSQEAFNLDSVYAGRIGRYQ